MTIMNSVALHIRRMIAMLLLPLAVPAVFVAVVFVVAWRERHVGLHSFWRMGFIDAAVALIVVGGFVFAAATLWLVRTERLVLPRLTDHLRHSALLYLGGAPLLIALVTNYPAQANGLAYGLAGLAFTAVLLAVATNGLVLLVIKIRHARPRAR